MSSGLGPPRRRQLQVAAAMLAAFAMCVAVGAIVFAVVAHNALSGVPRLPQTAVASVSRKRVAIIGAGLATATLLTALRDGGLQDAMDITVWEAGQAVGGRACSLPAPLAPVSTASAPQELGAWLFNPAAQPQVAALLARLGVRWSVQPGSQGAAHPVGYGWQDVVLRGIGLAPVTLGEMLQGVAATGPGASKPAVNLSFASGVTSSNVDAVILTVPAPALARLTGLPQATQDRLATLFDTQAVGVLYATWPSEALWWHGTPLQTAGHAATATALGDMWIAGLNDIRCTMTGRAHVSAWNSVVIEGGPAEASAAVAAALADAFDMPAGSIPPPSAVVFRPWMQGRTVWKAGNGVTSVAAALPALVRPFGQNIPVYWASADASLWPNSVQGAVHAGAAAAVALRHLLSLP